MSSTNLAENQTDQNGDKATKNTCIIFNMRSSGSTCATVFIPLQSNAKSLLSEFFIMHIPPVHDNIYSAHQTDVHILLLTPLIGHVSRTLQSFRL